MNEHGKYLQTMRMPLNHEAIIDRLPRSNRLNPPSSPQRLNDDPLNWHTANRILIHCEGIVPIDK